MRPLAPDLPIAIQLIRVERNHVVLHASGRDPAARCPAGGTPSTRVHDRDTRRPLDQPWRGWTVRFQLTVRRFRCVNAACSRCTFAEDFGPALRRRAQRTATCTHGRNADRKITPRKARPLLTHAHHHQVFTLPPPLCGHHYITIS